MSGTAPEGCERLGGQGPALLERGLEKCSRCARNLPDPFLNHALDCRPASVGCDGQDGD